MAEGGGSSGLQDDELYLPRTVVNKLIKEIVPNIRVTNDARDLLLNCCTEFIHLIASEASDISENQQKKVISPEHVVQALNTLGFQEYVGDVEAVHKEYKEQASKHRKRGKSKLDRLGIPEEELLRQQQQLFEEARQQQMESELLEHQRAQQLQQQQQQQQQSAPPHQQIPLPPQQHSQQSLSQPAHAPARLPHLAAAHPHHPQVPHQPGVTAMAPSSNPLAVPTQAPTLPLASAPRLIPQSSTAALRSTPAGPVAGPVAVSGGDDSQPKAGMPVQRSAQPAAQSINTAGLNMLAAVGAMQQQEHQQQLQATATSQPTAATPKAPQPILPNNAAITVASLQATSSLLQQALAMASAQVAANSTAQQQRPPVTSGAPSSVLGGATGSMLPLPQSLLLQQQALAALAAQQVQMGSHLGQPTSLSSSTGLASTLPAAASANAPGIGGSTDLKGQQGQGVSGSGLASGQPDYKPFPPT